MDSWGVKGNLLELEGAIGAAGKLVSSVAIGVSQALQADFEIAEIGMNFVTGQKQRQWELDDQIGTLNNYVSAGEHAISWLASNNAPLQIIRPALPDNMQKLLKTADKISSNDLKSVGSYLGDVANSVLKGDSYKMGGYAFDIGSLFVGAGELGVGAKGAELAEGVAKVEKVYRAPEVILKSGERAFKTSDVTPTYVRSLEYLDDFGKIKWPENDGFVLKNNKIDTGIIDLKESDIIDRWGDGDGRFASPVKNGEIFGYDTRGLPYVESTKKYYQYRLINDLTTENVEKGIAKLNAADREDFLELMERYGMTSNSLASPQIGQVADVFGQGGGIQIKFETTMEWYEKLGLFEEVK